MSLSIQERSRLGQIALILLLSSANLTHAGVNKLQCDELRRLQLQNDSNVFVIDVRSPKDFAQGRIQGAKNIMAAAFTNARIPKNSQIVVYCGEDTCPLSAAAADKLVTLGYTDVSLLKGGFNEWLRLHYPAQTGAVSPRGASIRRMGAEEAHRRIEHATITVLDVRPSLEFRAGHLPNARSVPVEGIGAAITNLPKDTLILIVDRLPQRSQQAVDKLSSTGFDVAELSGGIAGWVKRGFPLRVK
jgi:rhodanese-related sulfurtransferase